MARRQNTHTEDIDVRSLVYATPQIDVRNFVYGHPHLDEYGQPAA
jgi:hypothetical protein